MKKRICVVLLVMLFVLSSLTACGISLPGSSKPAIDDIAAVPEAEPETPEAQPDDGEAPEEEPAEPVEFAVEVTAVESRQVSQRVEQGAVLMGVTDSEFAMHFLVSVNAPVRDFCVWELESSADEDGNLTAKEKVCVAAEGRLETAALVTGEIGEVLPTLGISFVDPDGAQQHYFLSVSGESGLALLTAYTPAP